MGMKPGGTRRISSFGACVLACLLPLASTAPAGAQDRHRLSVDLGVAEVGAAGTGVDVNAGVADAHVGAEGVGVEVDAGPVQTEVTVPAPATPPATPAVPRPADVVDTVGGAVKDPSTVVPETGAGRTDQPSPSGGSTGSGSGGAGGDPRGRSSGPTGNSGGRDSGADGGTGGDRGGRDRGDRRRAVDGDGGAAGGPAVASNPAAARIDGGATTNDEGSGGVTRTLERVVEVIPAPIWAALVALALLALWFYGRGRMVGRRARRLAHQREELLRDVGLLQQALLPEIPEKLGDLHTTVAYRPADGPAAGGDFYDAFLLDGERVAIIVGDVSGHGRAALARTALMRYTLRAYLDAGLEPRRALKVAGRALDDDLGGDFATVVVAIHDPANATLTYSSAGHPPPIVTGWGAFEPVTALSSPPIGAGLPTGQRQTTLHLPGDAVACFFTDGLVEAKLNGGLLGRDRLANLLIDLGQGATAAQLIDAVATDADATPDDMAACVLRPDATGAADHVPDRVEEVELNALDLVGDRVERYLAACSVAPDEAAAALKSVEASVGEFGGALLRVRVDKTRACCEVMSAAGLHDPLGAPPAPDDAPGVDQPRTAATSDSVQRA
jgi:hypothetical protein